MPEAETMPRHPMAHEHVSNSCRTIYFATLAITQRPTTYGSTLYIYPPICSDTFNAVSRSQRHHSDHHTTGHHNSIRVRVHINCS